MGRAFQRLQFLVVLADAHLSHSHAALWSALVAWVREWLARVLQRQLID